MAKRKDWLRMAAALFMTAVVLLSCAGCVVIGNRKPIATLLFSNGAEVTIRLYPNKAPNTVDNFIKLANSGFYDGSPVHASWSMYWCRWAVPRTPMNQTPGIISRVSLRITAM